MDPTIDDVWLRVVDENDPKLLNGRTPADLSPRATVQIMMWAWCRAGQTDQLKKYHKYGVLTDEDVRVADDFALRLALKYRRIETARWLVECIRRTYTPYYRHSEAARWLQERFAL